MDTGENKLSAEMMKKLYEAYKLDTKKKIDEFNEAARKIISDKEYPEAEEVLKLVEDTLIVDNHEVKIHDPSICKYRGKQVLHSFFDEPYPVMMSEDVETMRGVSCDIINKLKEEIKERTLNLPKTSMEIKHYEYLDTDMCYNIYEMFSESKKLSLKSVVEWNRKCDRIDYTKDVKIDFRFPIFHEYGHIAELTSYCLNDVIFNQNNESVRQHMFTEKMNQESNFRKFIRKRK